MLIYRIIILAWVVALAGCSPSPVVTITNHSPVALTNVVVSGSGFSERIERIAAGAETELPFVLAVSRDSASRSTRAANTLTLTISPISRLVVATVSLLPSSQT